MAKYPRIFPYSVMLSFVSENKFWQPQTIWWKKLIRTIIRQKEEQRRSSGKTKRDGKTWLLESPHKSRNTEENSKKQCNYTSTYNLVTNVNKHTLYFFKGMSYFEHAILQIKISVFNRTSCMSKVGWLFVYFMFIENTLPIGPLSVIFIATNIHVNYTIIQCLTWTKNPIVVYL